MRPKNYRAVCMILAAIIFLTGIFFGNDKADELYTCPSTETTASCIQPVYAEITVAHPCTAEMLGLRRTGSTQQITCGKIGLKGGLRISLSSLCPDVFRFQRGKFYTGSDVEDIHSQYTDELVANYIQSSDGKKRI